MLSSFMHYRDTAKRKAAKTSKLLNINNPRRDQPPSPKSFASPDLSEIPGDIPPMPKFLVVPTQSKQEIDLDISRGNLLTTPESASSLPKVQLEISPGSLSDWFPSDLFNSDKFNFAEAVSQLSGPSVTETNGAGAEGIVADASGKRSGSGEAASGNGSCSSLVRPGNVNREAAVISDPSTFKPGDICLETVQDSPDSNFKSFWRPQPSPLTIPDDLQRALYNSAIFDLPESVVDDDMSAVSGATLARALIGNSFALSGESSRRRSLARHGFTITRLDSATLPLGESAQFSSFWRDRRVSGGEIVPCSDSGRTSPIPPVPPIPPHLVAKVDQQHPTAPSDEEENLTSVLDLGQPSGASTVGSFLASYADDSVSNFLNDPQHGDFDLEVLRRISQITEIPGTTFTSAPNTPPPDSFGALAQQSSGSSTYSSQIAPTGKASNRNSIKSGSNSPPLSTHPVKPTASLHKRTVSEPSTSLSPTSTHDTDHSLGSSESVGISWNPTSSPPERSESGSISSRPSSPLSNSQWGDKWDPRKRQKGSKGILGLTLSPNAPRAKVDWVLNRNRSGSLGGESYNPRAITRLPIGERPRSVTNATSPSESPIAPTVRPFAPTVSAESSKRVGQAATPNIIPPPIQETTDPTNIFLVPTNTRNVFNRQRAGSTPSPITINRDSKDLDSYNITVAGGTAGLNGLTPTITTGRQTFPETPSEFSPVWSAGSVTSPFQTEYNGLLNSISSSDHSRTMSLSGSSSGAIAKPNFAQQVMLNRAATSVRGARHGNRPKVTAPSHPYARSIPVLLTPPPEETNSEDGQPSADNNEESSTANTLVDRMASPSHNKLSVELTTANGPPSPLAQEPSSSNSTNASNNNEAPSPSQMSLPASNDSQRPDSSSEELSTDKPLPPRPPKTPVDTIGESSVNSSRENGPVDAPSRIPVSNSVPVRNNVPVPLPLPSPPNPITSTPPTSTSVPSSPPIPNSQTFTPQTPAFPPISGRSDISHSYSSSFTLSLGAPPPYYSIVPSGVHGEHEGEFGGGSFSRNLDSPGHSASPSYADFRSPATTDASQSPGIDGVLPSGSSSPSRQHRMARMRPPLPAGPRNPFPPGVHRNISASSVGSTSYSESIHNSQRVGYSNTSAFVPKFQAPPMKWRGYTMDAAKWTFTSEQLQAIVSRAIRQSAEAYSIRLLRLETLDNDIPEEMHRLDLRGTDVKARYKALSRQRYSLLLSLSAQVEGTSKGDPVFTSRLVGELAEVSATLDHLAEELHSIDEQVANLRSLRDVHSASALAMALRKLNTSFLRQLSETQALRAQVDMLESERDEAWKQAEDVAHEYDDLTEKVLETNGLQTSGGLGGPGGPGGLTRSGSRRSSRVLAVRKSSIRVSKAGLRPSRSQRSSVSSMYRASLSPMSAGRTTFSADDIPPVPPIPIHRPLGIDTAGLQSRSSMGVSTGSPTSETRAMVKAQEELYAILGISPVENGGLRRRPLSLSGTPVISDSSPLPPDSSRSRRSVSRPRSAGSAVLSL